MHGAKVRMGTRGSKILPAELQLFKTQNIEG
jgi:hypothetical protein